MSWKHLNCNDPREQLCSVPPHCYVVCPSYLKNKQRHLSVAGRSERCALLFGCFCFVFGMSFRTGMIFRCVLYRTCVVRNVVLLYCKHRARMFLQHCVVNNRQTGTSQKHTSVCRSMPYRVLLAGCPVDLRR